MEIPTTPNNNTGGSQNQSGIILPIDGEVSELESELICMIRTTGKEKNYELVEYVSDVNREHTEVLMELNINGILDTAYSYGNECLTNERLTEWTGYHTYDPRGSVTGVTDSKGMIWQSYCYDVNGELTFGKPQYNNVYSYNAESYNPNMESQYLRARYYNVPNGNFLMENSYLGKIMDPLTLNRYNYVKGSPLNYVVPSGHDAKAVLEWGTPAGGFVAMLDGPLPGYVDAVDAIILGGGAMVAGGMIIYNGITYIGDQISQAKAKKKKDKCQTDISELPANTTDAVKKGSKEWNDVKKRK